MRCGRCGNKFTPAIPGWMYCNDCEICPDCYGRGSVEEKGVFIVCKKCKGKRWIFAKQENVEDYFTNIF